ncbi:MAG TPA: DUF1772 domain-containing protein [Thermomicrobiales bacterium]|nr:DUF1772 domain-containing protein [Thermomicrobiales bacterium]
MSSLIIAQEAASASGAPALPSAVLAAATVATGLAAGVFYTYQVSVTRALAQVGDDAYVATFQSINRTIQNAGFAASFIGAPVLIVASLATWWGEDRQVAGTIAAGLVLQAVSLAITGTGNIPLNAQLERTGLVTGAEASDARNRFESRWNRLHAARTFASIGSFTALTIAGYLAMTS